MGNIYKHLGLVRFIYIQRELFLLKTIYFDCYWFLSLHFKFFGVIKPFNFTTSDIHYRTNGFCLQISIMDSKCKIEKFSIDNNFGQWKVNMQAILTQEKCFEPLKGKSLMLAFLTQREKGEIVYKSISVIIVCFMDKILRKVAWENTVTLVWIKLESLYMTIFWLMGCVCNNNFTYSGWQRIIPYWSS